MAQSIAMGGAIPTGISAMGAAIGAVIGAATGGPNNPGGEDDAGAGTAGEDGAPPATGSSASSEAGASAAGEDGARPPAGDSTTSIAGATNADRDGAGADPDPDADEPTPVGVDVPRTGINRCDRCKREQKRNCWHR